MQYPFLGGGIVQETLPDLPGGTLDKREHQRAGIIGGARHVDYPDNPPGGWIGNGDRRAGQPRQGVSEMFLAGHQCRATACDRRADRVRADLLFPVPEAGGEVNAVEQPCRVVVGRPAGQDPGPLIGQQKPNPGAVQVTPHLVENRPGCPAEPAMVIHVSVVGHLEPFGSQPRAGTTLPGGDDFVTQPMAFSLLGRGRGFGRSAVHCVRVGA